MCPSRPLQAHLSRAVLKRRTDVLQTTSGPPRVLDSDQELIRLELPSLDFVEQRPDVHNDGVAHRGVALIVRHIAPVGGLA